MKAGEEHMLRAWLILTVGGILLVITMPSYYTDTRSSLLIVDLVSAILSPAVTVFLLRKIATRDGLLKRSKPIKTWGYIWRSLVAYYAALLPTVLGLALLVSTDEIENLLARLTFILAQLLMLTLTIWLFFSHDRRGQLHWTMSLLRGY